MVTPVATELAGMVTPVVIELAGMVIAAVIVQVGSVQTSPRKKSARNILGLNRTALKIDLETVIYGS